MIKRPSDRVLPTFTTGHPDPPRVNKPDHQFREDIETGSTRSTPPPYGRDSSMLFGSDVDDDAKQPSHVPHSITTTDPHRSKEEEEDTWRAVSSSRDALWPQHAPPSTSLSPLSLAEIKASDTEGVTPPIVTRHGFSREPRAHLFRQWRANWIAVMGKAPYLWFLPIRPPHLQDA